MRPTFTYHFSLPNSWLINHRETLASISLPRKFLNSCRLINPSQLARSLASKQFFRGNFPTWVFNSVKRKYPKYSLVGGGGRGRLVIHTTVWRHRQERTWPRIDRFSLFGYPTASEFGPSPWDSWNGITVARFRDAGGGTWKFGRFHESQMRDEMTLNSRTFARITRKERAALRWRGARSRGQRYHPGDVKAAPCPPPLMALSAFTAAVCR